MPDAEASTALAVARDVRDLTLAAEAAASAAERLRSLRIPAGGQIAWEPTMRELNTAGAALEAQALALTQAVEIILSEQELWLGDVDDAAVADLGAKAWPAWLIVRAAERARNGDPGIRRTYRQLRAASRTSRRPSSVAPVAFTPDALAVPSLGDLMAQRMTRLGLSTAAEQGDGARETRHES